MNQNCKICIVVLLSGVVVALFFGVVLLLPDIQVPEIIAFDVVRLRLVNEYRRTWAVIAGGISVLFGAAVALWRADIARRQVLVIEQGNITERFSRAVDQLGKLNENDGTPHVVIRLGGIYALEQIAKDDPRKYHWQVVEVLAAYVRESTARYPGIADIDGLKIVPEEEFQNPPQGPTKPQEDVQAALMVIARLGPAKSQQIKLNNTWLRKAVFPKAAKLHGADFSNANLLDADFTEAVLDGASFLHANLKGAWFENAQMNGTSLQNACLTAIQEGDIPQLTNMQNAKLNFVSFEGTELESALLQGADLTNANGLKRLQLCSSNFDETTIMPNGKSGYSREQICDQKIDVGLFDELMERLQQDGIAEVKAARERNTEEQTEE